LVSTESIKRVKETIRKVTRRTRGIAFEAIINELNQKLVGWVRYFKLAEAQSLMQSLDKRIRRKLRCYKLKQMKRARTIASFLISRHIANQRAWQAAASGKGPWRISASWQLHKAMGNGWLEIQGLKSLEKIYLSG
jgi:RNA-directed DNA polymerase